MLKRVLVELLVLDVRNLKSRQHGLQAQDMCGPLLLVLEKLEKMGVASTLIIF
jgi:hypothetical protein